MTDHTKNQSTMTILQPNKLTFTPISKQAKPRRIKTKNKSLYLQLTLLASGFLYLAGIVSCSNCQPPMDPVSKPSYTSTNINIVSNINLSGLVLYHHSNIDVYNEEYIFLSNGGGSRAILSSDEYLSNHRPVVYISSNNSPNTNVQTNISFITNHTNSEIITNIKTVTNTDLRYQTNQIPLQTNILSQVTNLNWVNRDLSGWDLRDLNLSNYSFSNAILLGANLTNANLTNANLTNARVNLEGYLYLSHHSYTGYISDDFQKVLAGDRAINDNFGISVSIDGDTALIGAYRDTYIAEMIIEAGSAYVFIRTGDTWTQQQKLIASDKASSDRFGVSVSLDGDTALVGAHRDDDEIFNSGSAYVFTRTGDTWVQQQKLTALDQGYNDRFGVSVSIDGDTALIGAYHDNVDEANNTGSAYVFTRTAGTWTQQQKLIASDKDTNDFFGRSVSLDGDTALIGASGDKDNAGVSNAGSAYVFIRTAGTWTQQQKLTALDKTGGDLFGISVSLDGDTALIGASMDNNGGLNSTGSAYLFTRTGDTWSQYLKLLASDKTATDNFGISVSLDGNKALIGAYLDSGGGSAYVFTRTVGTWTQHLKLRFSDRVNRDDFGYSVSLDGDRALIGAYQVDNFQMNSAANDSGAAYVLELE